MVPGLTSKGGRIPDPENPNEQDGVGNEDLAEGTIVAVGAEGKEEICMIGPLKMSTKEMREKKKGIAMDAGHYLGDGLWKMNFN